MGDQVYRVGVLRQLVVDGLRKRGHATTAEGVERETGLPAWAVAEGLKAAQLAGKAYVVGAVNGHDFWGLTEGAVVGAEEKVTVAAIGAAMFSTINKGD